MKYSNSRKIALEDSYLHVYEIKHLSLFLTSAHSKILKYKNIRALHALHSCSFGGLMDWPLGLYFCLWPKNLKVHV
jgi:hypothetical protein